MYWVLDLCTLCYCDPVLHKISIYWFTLSNKSVYYYGWQRMTFCTSLWTNILEMQLFILKVDTSCTMTNLMVDTRANKMKGINMTTDKDFVPLLAYWRSQNLFNPTAHYFTVSHYLQSRRHQCRLLSFPGEVHTARKGQSLETSTRNKFEHTTKAQHDLKVWDCLFLSCWVCITFEEVTNQARSLHAAKESATWINHSFTTVEPLIKDSLY